MDIDIDGGTLLYVLGIGFAIAAFAYFVRDVVFALSITVKAGLLFVSFLAFLSGGIAMDRDVLDRLSLVLAGAAYVVFLGYVVTRYDMGATKIFLVLAASAVLFIGLGYSLRRERLELDPKTGAKIVGVLIVVGVLLVGADVMTASVTHTLEVEDSVMVSAPPDGPPEPEFIPAEATVGTLTVTNEGPFTRPLSLPAASACVAGVETTTEPNVHIGYRPRGYERPNRIAGGESQSYSLVARLRIPNETDEVTYDVERGTDCDTPREQPTVLIEVEETTGR